MRSKSERPSASSGVGSERVSTTWPTYADRQVAQRWSSGMAAVLALGPSRDLGGEAGGEVVDVDAPLGLIAAPGVDADGPGLDVLVADDEDVRELLELGLADAGPQGLVGLDEVGPEAVRLEP